MGKLKQPQSLLEASRAGIFSQPRSVLTPEPTPEPPPWFEEGSTTPVDPEELLDEVTTRDLVTVLAARAYDALEGAFKTLNTVLADLDRRQREDHDLLQRLVADLDPSYLRPAPEPVAQPVAPEKAPTVPQAPPPVPAAPRANGTPHKLKVAVVGVIRDQIGAIMNNAGRVADVRCFEDPQLAAKNGFKSYDRVVLSRHCSHAVQVTAQNDAGRDAVRRMETTSAAAINGLIREMAAAH